VYCPAGMDVLRTDDETTFNELAAVVAETGLETVSRDSLLRMAGRTRWSAAVPALVKAGLATNHLCTDIPVSKSEKYYRVYDEDGIVAALLRAVNEPTPEGNGLLRRLQLRPPEDEMVHDMDLAQYVTGRPQPNLREAVAVFNAAHANVHASFDSGGFLFQAATGAMEAQYALWPEIFEYDIANLDLLDRARDLIVSWVVEANEYEHEKDWVRDVVELFHFLDLSDKTIARVRRPVDTVEFRPDSSAGGVAAVSFDVTGRVLFTVTEADAAEFGAETIEIGGHTRAILGDLDIYTASDLAECAFRRWTDRFDEGRGQGRKLTFNQYRAHQERLLGRLE
jgi:hypothetical protein